MHKLHKCKKLLLHSLILTLILGISIFGGYFVGNLINGKFFTFNKYENLTDKDLRDDLSLISYENKMPNDFSGPIVFQIAEEIMMNATSYEMYGYSNIETSAGVSSKSLTKDVKNGNTHTIEFATYNSIIKTAKKSTFNVGEKIRMYDGSATDNTLENCKWSNKFTDYTWEEYYSTFGKYANRNSTYIVSSKTTTFDSAAIIEENLYRFDLELDPSLSTIGYVKQIANNAGLNPSSIVFNKVSLTFWVDKDFRLVKHKKFESYTIPYGGINVTLEISNSATYNITI